MAQVKQCTKCKDTKPLTTKFFYRRAQSLRHLWHSICKTCLAAGTRRYYARVKHTRWFKKRAKVWARKNYLKATYDVSLEDFDRQWKKQRGRCAICRRKFSGPKNPHVDHCHKTGVFRGILCAFCNIALGMFRDDIQVMRRAVKYVLTSRRNKRRVVGRPTGEHSNRLPDFRGGKEYED